MKTNGPIIGIVAMFAAGCSHFGPDSSPHEISSTPPASAIQLKKPAVVSDEGATTRFPAGKYRPVYEDKGGYYFEAPEKVLVDDVAVYAFDGGLYVERGKTAPTHWYIVRPNGRRSMGHFKTLPSYKLVP
jgi:hypothetical protein